MARGSQQETGFRDPKVLLPFLLITLIWSSTWIVIKDQLGPIPSEAVPPPWSVAYRFLIAAAAMFALARFGALRLGLDAAGHRLAAMTGLLQFALNYNLVYAAELSITSGLAAVVFALLVLPNAVLARIFFGERVTAGFVLGSAVAMAGVALLFVQEARQATVPLAGVLTGLGLTVLAVLAASISNVMQLSDGMRARSIAVMLGWAMLYGGIINAAFAWAVSGPPVAEARPGYWLGLLYLSVIASALAFWLYYRIIRAVGAARAAYSSVLIPIVAMLISTVAEGYRWSPPALAGGMLGIAGLIIALRSRRAVPPPPAD
ncbi:DMT family transporter [Sphingosinicella sp.]|uniref:DMT family transporter n=1 Tax=Sphingosinicella sp. TaxID=1917971 RepID=UPI00403812AF